MVSPPFSLQIADLVDLGPDRAVEFVRRLLWAEAARVGIGRNLAIVPQCINVGDGGLDAMISDATPSNEELIPRGTSGFQIKATNLEPQACKKELHQNGDLSKPLKPEVNRLLDLGGTYILILFASLDNARIRRRENAIKEELRSLGYQSAKIRLYTAEILVGFAEQFLPLVNWLKPELSQGLPYSTWSENADIAAPRAFVADETRNEWITGTREVLRDPGNRCPIFRIEGLSGIGKTRLVFEALSPDDVKNRVLYVKADQFRSSNLFYTLQNEEHRSAVLVIDECDLQQHDEFVRSFSQRGPRLAVITLSYDVGRVAPPTSLIRLTPVGEDAIKEILEREFPEMPRDVTGRLAEFADGYPRIAVLLGESYALGGGTSQDFITASDDALMNRLIGGRSDVNSSHFRSTQKVLTGLSLFQKVGYEGELSQEAQWVAERMGVNWNDFREVVAEQKQRGIIQGNYYLYVTPLMLRVHLLTKWWEYQGLTKEEFTDFVASIPDNYRADLIERFIEGIPYISFTSRGQVFTEALLGDEGIFADGELLKTEIGAKLFLALTEANPSAALKRLERTVGNWNSTELLQFTTGRRDVVWALEKIAVWKELFTGAAQILLALGEAENETWSNNASGVFADLFTPAPRPASPTEASPEERFTILEMALNSDTKERRKLALNACSTALSTGPFHRAIGAEFQGLRREPDLWSPKTYGEMFDAYRRVWNLLFERLDYLPEDERKEAINVLLQNARGLTHQQNLADMVIDTMYGLVERPGIEKKDVLSTAVQIIHYDGKRLPSEVRVRWEELRDTLTGTDYSSLMKRYVGTDLLEDRFDDDGNQIDQKQSMIEELAQQSIDNPDLLERELEWLVTPEAQDGFRFGYELGKRDENFSLLLSLVQAQRGASSNQSLMFLGGYFRSMAENAQDRWEGELDQISEDEQGIHWVCELTWRSGLRSDRAANRILTLAERGIIQADNFRMFIFGGVIRDLSVETFAKWIEFLLNSDCPTAASIALELYHMYYRRREPRYQLSKDLTFQLLTHPSWFSQAENNQTYHRDDYAWSETANAFIRDYPESSLDLADIMLEYYGRSDTIVGGFHSRAQTVLEEILRQFPEQIWERLVKYLGPPRDSRAFYITDWLKGGFSRDDGTGGALIHIPQEKIWQWVDKDVENRAWYAATFVPKSLFLETGKVCLARELLVRYGEREDVRRNFSANFSTESWVGSESMHHLQKKQRLLEFKEKEDNPNVIQWIDDYVQGLDHQIEQAKIREEREGI